jgi:hypothetical protein
VYQTIRGEEWEKEENQLEVEKAEKNKKKIKIISEKRRG